jgi:uncharacterized surface protein with fasciclin (FAS1) repeats
MTGVNQWLTVFTIFVSLSILPLSATQAKNPQRFLLAARTEAFSEKAGFERQPKDVINTLKANEVTSFQYLYDGLQQAFGLDKMLKGPGPYTVFAPSDEAFRRLSDEDRHALFDDKPRLRRTLMYHIVEGNFGSQELKNQQYLKSTLGQDVSISWKGSDLYANNSLVILTDVPCTNGVVHVVDQVLFPQSGQ